MVRSEKMEKQIQQDAEIIMFVIACNETKCEALCTMQ
jgi:hypothetical protein